MDGRVSIEVDPRLAHETERTTAEANGLWWLVDRPNVHDQDPGARQAGLPSITAATAAGISVNVTLIFGLDRYDQVMDAYLTGLEQAKEAGIDLSTIRSVASFFVSRVDTEIDKRLDKLGTDEAKALRGKAGIANARLAYERYEKVIASDRAGQALEGRRCERAATAVGLDRREGPGVRRHDVRRRARRPGHRQHDARGDARRGGRPRPDPR